MKPTPKLKPSGLVALVLILSILAAYITHLIWSLGGLFTGGLDTASSIATAVLGTFIPPVGVLHGFYLWFS